ncbi:hypothetical protein C5167_021515 [Papaver somniferum]|nr:hypothetical protein C5167_021515 [Papaver somniferum]
MPADSAHSVLHSFCMVDPTLCSPASDPSQFVVTLQPYLKTQGDNRAVAQLLESIIFVIDAVLPLLRKPPQSVAKELEQDLKHMIVRHSFLTVVHACIKYLLHLVFLKRLDTLGDDAKQALGFVLIAKPEYMLQRETGKILEATPAPGSNDRLKMQALQKVYEYLLDSESEMGTDKTTSSTTTQYADAAQNVPVAAGAGDTNICGGIVQLYWDSILKVCLDMNKQVRQSAVKIVEVVLRQGLVHPITCVPHLIALETGLQEVNSKLVHHLLANMNAKYPSFLGSHLGDGLQMSFFSLQSMTLHSVEYPKEKGSGIIKGKADGNSFNLGSLEFLEFTGEFEETVFPGTSLCTPSYSTEILASLPFTTPDDPLYLIYSVNRVIQVKAGALEANLKALIFRLTETGTQTTPQENGRIQQDATPSPVSSNITTEDSKRHSSTSSDSGGRKIFSEIRKNLPTASEQFVERYQEFKAALKEDIMDYSIYTCNIKRKCPPARSSRGGRSGRETGYYDEDEDYDDGYDNTKLNNSGRKNNSGRGRARQRL